MTLLVEKGTFTKTTSTGVPVSQQVNLNNGSLTPKLLILWTTGQTTINGTYRDDARISFGFSDGTNDACQSYRMDESAESESYTFRSDSVIAIINLTTNAIVSQADVSAFAAGSFTLNWSVQSNTEALHIHYIVAGGTDITNVSVVSTTVGDTSTGNHSYNGSGTTFTPDFAMAMTGANSYDTINTLSTSADNAFFCIGAARSTTKEWVMWGRDETVATSDCDMYLDPDALVAACTNTAGVIDFLGNFISFNSAAGGGITINVSNASPSANKKLAFLFVKGGEWDVGAFQQRSGTGTQDVTITTDLNPEIVFLGGINTTNTATVTTSFHVGIGASDGTREGASYMGNTDGLGTFAAVNSDLDTKVYRIATPHATATSSTTNAECDMNDMATASKFQLNWTTADSTQRRMVFWTLGTLSSLERVTKDVILKWNIIGRITKNVILKWNIIGRITKNVILKWHILGRITKNLILKWNIIGRITKDLILKWNIIGRITKNVILKWHILGRITKALILKWHITTLVTKNLILKWNIQQHITKDLILKWNIIGRITKSVILKWNIIGRITKDIILKWNIVERVTKAVILKWNVIGRITKSVILKWHIIGRITKDVILKWHIIGRITKSVILKWNIQNFITKNLTLKWNIDQRITKALTLKWNIQQRITKALTLKWNIIGRITKTLTLKWNIIGRITKDLVLKWNIIGRITKNTILKWNIIGRINKTLTLKWNIIGRITKNLILKWNIEAGELERVTKNVILKWHIVGRITKNTVLKWNIIGRITKTVTLKWNIQERITKALTLKWHIHQRITKSVILKWNIVGRITKDIILKWNIIGRITKTLTLKWNILTRVTKTITLKWHITILITKNLILKWNIVSRVTKTLTLVWSVLSTIRTIEFPGITVPTVPKGEGVREKRKSPGWWRNSFYTHIRTRRKGTSNRDTG